jgi:hypothetical protein
VLSKTQNRNLYSSCLSRNQYDFRLARDSLQLGSNEWRRSILFDNGCRKLFQFTSVSLSRSLAFLSRLEGRSLHCKLGHYCSKFDSFLCIRFLVEFCPGSLRSLVKCRHVCYHTHTNILVVHMQLVSTGRLRNRINHTQRSQHTKAPFCSESGSIESLRSRRTTDSKWTLALKFRWLQSEQLCVTKRCASQALKLKMNNFFKTSGWHLWPLPLQNKQSNVEKSR